MRIIMPSFISVSLHTRSGLTRSPLTMINYVLILLFVLFWLCRYLVLVLLYLLLTLVMPWIDIISFDALLSVSQYASIFPILISIACWSLCIVFVISVDFYSFCCFADEFLILKNVLDLVSALFTSGNRLLCSLWGESHPRVFYPP